MARTTQPGMVDTAASRRHAAAENVIERWLVGFAVAVIVGMQVGTIFEPLGSVGETRLADWIDLATPFAVLGCAVVVLDRATAPGASWAWMFVGGVAFALGHGLHLAANSISNVADETVAGASIVHLWDEVASHYIWYAGLYLVFVALWIAVRDRPIRMRPAGVVLAVLVAVTLVNTYIEGGVAWFGLGALATGIVAGSRRPTTSAGRLAVLVSGVGFVLLAGWGVAWYVVDGSVFPEFSELGWI